MNEFSAKQAFNVLTWYSDYWDGDHISFNKDKLEIALQEIEENLTSHNNDCTATVQEPSPKSPDGDFVQSQSVVRN